MRLKVKISGSRVHEVDYRVYLLRKALELGMERFNAYNTKENGMQVLNAFLEGNKDQITVFQEFTNENKPEDAEVSDRVFEDYGGYVIGIADYMHLIQVEQLSKGIPAILSIDRKQDKMLEKQDKMLEKQDKMLEKQDLHIKITKTGFADVKEEIHKGFGEVKEEIHMLRDDFKELFMHEVSELRSEIAEIKATLARMQAAG
ncbi:MAG: acylphosphatase [Candidatus Methanoperedens sp.]|nr:acylphosphatase [Candidatus Methanoperedens sp.]